MKNHLILFFILFFFPSICLAEFKVDGEAVAFILGFIILFLLFLVVMLLYSFRIPEQLTKKHFFYLLFQILFYNYVCHVNDYYSIFSGVIKDIMEGYFFIIFAILLYKRMKIKLYSNYRQLLFIGILLVQIIDILLPYVFHSIFRLFNHSFLTILLVLLNFVFGYFFSKTTTFNHYFNELNLKSILKIFIVIYSIPLLSFYFYIIVNSLLSVEGGELFSDLSSYFFTLDILKSVALCLGMILIRFIAFNIGVYFAFTRLRKKQL